MYTHHSTEYELELRRYLSKLEFDLMAQGYMIQELLNYLADVNEKEMQRQQQAQEIKLLMIFGGDDLIGLQKIFALYFKELRHKGANTILITGGIGRLTETLIKALLKQQRHGEFSSLNIQKQGNSTQVIFETTEKFLGRKKVKILKRAPFDLNASKESLLPYVAEADIYLELLLDKFLQHNCLPNKIEVFGYDDYTRDTHNRFIVDEKQTELFRRENLLGDDSYIYALQSERTVKIAEARKQGKIVILLENTSTNTGNNTRYALEMLITTGYLSTCSDARRIIQQTAVYQQPASQLRTKYTVAKQFGELPLTVSYAPDYPSLSLCERVNLLLLMAGEYKRLLLYSQKPYNFFRRPENFDDNVAAFFHKHSEMLTQIECLHKRMV